MWNIHPVFHTELLSKVTKNSMYGPIKLIPVPDVINSEQEYEVKAVLKECMYQGHQQYLVKWKGYLLSEWTWKPASHLQHVAKALQEFKDCFKTAHKNTIKWSKLQNA